jgi:3-deoxy-D-manno-octulosonate 8-phosphate phosphatase (KDO 8-P phosphatase)
VPEVGNLDERLRAVRCVALDVDGVLTDGRIYVSDDGQNMRAFDVKDGTGIIYLQRAGIPVAVLSGESREAVRHRARRLDIRTVLLGFKDKLAGFRELLKAEGVEPRQVCYVGDDLPDVPPMRSAGLAVAVADAHPLVREAAHWVTRQPGGRGAVREIAERILQAQGLWASILARYFPEGHP